MGYMHTARLDNFVTVLQHRTINKLTTNPHTIRKNTQQCCLQLFTTETKECGRWSCDNGAVWCEQLSLPLWPAFQSPNGKQQASTRAGDGNAPSVSPLHNGLAAAAALRLARLHARPIRQR